MITETYFGKRENLDMNDKEALLRSLVYMFDKTEAKHGCILTFLHIEEIKRVHEWFVADKEGNRFFIRVIGDNKRIVDIFPVEYLVKSGVSAQRVFQGFRFDYLSILGVRNIPIYDNILKECIRRFEYLL